MRTMTMMKLVAVLATCVATPAMAQKGKGKCTGTAPDSVMLLSGVVYRDCDVDKPAKRKGGEPKFRFQPNGGGVPRESCYTAEFQFVIDTTGTIEPASVRPSPTNDRDLEEAVSAVLGTMRFEPARLGQEPVRQVSTYRATVGVMVRTVSSRPGPPSISSSRPPRC